MVAGTRSWCRLHLPQQGVHLLAAQSPSRPHRAVAGHGGSDFLDIVAYAQRAVFFRQIVGKIAEQALGVDFADPITEGAMELLVESGVTGIMNFAPTVLQVPNDVTVNNVNMAIELENLSYFVQQ